MHPHGIHHLTAVTARPRDNVDFYTRVLGMRLVKKTVNQDDVHAYHLFYGDGAAAPGSDLTFFDFPVPPEQRGTHSIARTGLRVADPAALQWWRERFAGFGIDHGPIASTAGWSALDFTDPEGQRLALVADGATGTATPWWQSPVPADYQIRGLGPVSLSVPDAEPTARVLHDVLGMTHERTEAVDAVAGAERHVFRMGASGPQGELHLWVEPEAPPARPGAGGAHHVAFRIRDHDYGAWTEHLRGFRLPASGPVDRFYFRSLYFREPNGILFELATDGPGFTVDEPLASLGQRLSLPPGLEPRRREIEAQLKPL